MVAGSVHHHLSTDVRGRDKLLDREDPVETLKRFLVEQARLDRTPFCTELRHRPDLCVGLVRDLRAGQHRRTSASTSPPLT